MHSQSPHGCGLINDRARLAQLVGISKTREGKTVDFYRPEREAQVLRMAKERNNGPLRDEEVLRLFREIIRGNGVTAPAEEKLLSSKALS